MELSNKYTLEKLKTVRDYLKFENDHWFYNELLTILNHDQTFFNRLQINYCDNDNFTNKLMVDYLDNYSPMCIDIFNKLIDINLKELDKYLDKEANKYIKDDNKLNKDTLKGILAMNNFFHVSTHIVQLKESNDAELSRLYHVLFNEINLAFPTAKIRKVYKKDPSKLAFEREANLSSLQLLDSLYEEYYEDILIKKLYLYNLLKGYENENNPVDYTLHLDKWPNNFKLNHLSFYDKLYLGLEVKPDEINYVKSLIQDKPLEDIQIKKLVKEFKNM